MHDQSANSAAQSGRQHGFDAVRVGGMLLVVLLHAAAPYIVHRMPGLLWPTFDAQPSLLIDGLFWWIESFVMTLFFALSGYFACSLLQRRSVLGFVGNRCRRLLLPLLLATLIVLPLTAYVWVFGWFVEGQVAAVKLRSFKFEDSVAADFFGFAHLWYLQYLVIYSLGAAALVGLWKWFRGRDTKPAANDILQSWMIPITAFAGCVALLTFDPEIIAGFQQSIPPVPTRLAYFALVFAVGAWLFGRKESIASLQRFAWPALAASAGGFAIALPLLFSQLNGRSESLLSNAALAASLTAFAWLTAAGLVGLSVRFASRPNAVVRYLAEASFWVYLTHMPIVGATHILLAPTGLPVVGKLVLAFAATLAISLASYELLVRRWPIAGWLNGGYPPPRSNVAVVCEAKAVVEFERSGEKQTVAKDAA